MVFIKNYSSFNSMEKLDERYDILKEIDMIFMMVKYLRQNLGSIYTNLSTSSSIVALMRLCNGDLTTATKYLRSIYLVKAKAKNEI